MVFAVILAFPLVCASAEVYRVPYSSRENWGFYLRDCKRISEDTTTVERQIQEGSTVLFTSSLRSLLDNINGILDEVSAADRDRAIIAECEATISHSRSVLAKATEYEKNHSMREEKEAREARLASPEYKEAKARGFSDYAYLGDLDNAYRRMGEKKLRSMMIIVDPDCAAYFRAVQKVGPYVLFAPPPSHRFCAGNERVVVLPAAGVSFGRGQFIDRHSYYSFQGLLEGTGMDGFPAKILAVKQVLVKERAAVKGANSKDLAK